MSENLDTTYEQSCTFVVGLFITYGLYSEGERYVSLNKFIDREFTTIFFPLVFNTVFLVIYLSHSVFQVCNLHKRHNLKTQRY